MSFISKAIQKGFYLICVTIGVTYPHCFRKKFQFVLLIFHLITFAYYIFDVYTKHTYSGISLHPLSDFIKKMLTGLLICTVAVITFSFWFKNDE
jgi:hypothetical protein